MGLYVSSQKVKPQIDETHLQGFRIMRARLGELLMGCHYRWCRRYIGRGNGTESVRAYCAAQPNDPRIDEIRQRTH